MGMIIENSFSVPAARDKVVTYLLDVDKVAKCLPGASVTKKIDAQNLEGKLKVKMGPLDLLFSGKVQITGMSDTQITMKASGREEKGKGIADANVTVTITESGGQTHVKLHQDVNMSGQIASMGRGMMADVAGSMINGFAACLKQNIK